MSSEQKKFSPELMGGRSIASKVRGFLSSVLDIGKSVRVRIGRITRPDYDAVSDILAERNAILGHEFNESSQKRAEPVDPMLSKANKAIKDLDKLEVENPVVDHDESVSEPDPVEAVEEPVIEVKPDVVETVEEEVKEEIVPAPPLQIEDEVADILKAEDKTIVDSESLFDDERDNEMVTNVISIDIHDELIEQMTIDDLNNNATKDDTLKFPESRPVQKQTTLDIEEHVPEPEVEEVTVPWYTDADLIRIAIRAATEDCIETIAPLMEVFDEPEVVEEEVVDEMDLKLTDMAVRAMTEDAVETIIIRLAQAARVAEAISVPVSEPVEEITVTEMPVVEMEGEPVVVEEEVIVEEPVIEDVAVVEEQPVVEVPVTEAVVPEKDDGVSVSFRFGAGASGTSSVGVRFRFGVLSQ